VAPKFLESLCTRALLSVYYSIRDATSTAEARWRMLVKNGESKGMWREAEVVKAW